MSQLKRALHPMPLDIAEAIAERGLAEEYDERPPFQRNDYLSWIERAKRPETRAKRLAQMLDELEVGNSYMDMAWHPGKGDLA